MQGFAGNNRITGDEGQHGSHIGMDHAGTLGDTGHGHFIPAKHFRHRHGLDIRIGCQNGLGKIIRIAIDHQLGQALFEGIHG